ncbi:CBS domain-containing protein [Peribacillus acanthi]|uniref:CBS domain-containing protein n=1 Tax=Peribacillus acanthi TaxID=2171554 RepID=UPI000D3E051B|nr:CBS domain-containing protein [Peribacillus acanthi]
MKTLRDIMTTDVETCTPLDNAYEVAVKMKEHDVGAIPICDAGNIVGIITDRDLALRCIADKHPGSSKVTDIMSERLVTANPDMSVDEASALMAKEQIRRLPVVEGKKLVGIVALGDLAVRDESEDEAGQALSEISHSNENQIF